MPDTEHKITLERKAMQRLAKALGVKDEDLKVEGSDTTMTRILTYDRISEILEEQAKTAANEAKAAGKAETAKAAKG